MRGDLALGIQKQYTPCLGGVGSLARHGMERAEETKTQVVARKIRVVMYISLGLVIVYLGYVIISSVFAGIHKAEAQDSSHKITSHQELEP